MTLLQMSYILEVDRCGSMNRAARNLFLSQSALSAAIAEVERELGVTIFLRTNRGVTLTEEGRELTAQIAPLVERSRKLERYYSERRAADRVSLSVASQRYPFCAKAFVEFLHLLDEPHIQVSFKEMEMAAVIDEVTARRSAFGIIFVSDMTEHFIGRILREKNLTFQPLVDIRPRVFLRKGHPLSGERAVRLEQLYAYPYAVFTQSDSNYHFAEEAVVGTGAEFDRVVSVSDRATAYNVMAHRLRFHRQRRTAGRLRRRPADDAAADRRRAGYAPWGHTAPGRTADRLRREIHRHSEGYRLGIEPGGIKRAAPKGRLSLFAGFFTSRRWFRSPPVRPGAAHRRREQIRTFSCPRRPYR